MTAIDKLSNYELFDKCDDACYQIASYWLERKTTFLDEASDEFLAKVVPAVWVEGSGMDEKEMMVTNMIFTDWVLYEWQKGGLYSKYLDLYSDKMGEQTKEVLTQIRDTQFFSNFIITGKCPEKDTIDLLDRVSGKEYRVIDPQAAGREDWNDGALAVRIARVGNRWVAIGQAHFHDINKDVKMATPDSIGMVHFRDIENGVPTHLFTFYECFMRDLIGIDGVYRTPLKVRML